MALLGHRSMVIPYQTAKFESASIKQYGDFGTNHQIGLISANSTLLLGVYPSFRAGGSTWCISLVAIVTLLSILHSNGEQN